MACPICTGQGSACYCQKEQRTTFPTWEQLARDKVRRLAEDKRIAEQTVAMLDAEKRILADTNSKSPRMQFLKHTRYVRP